MRLDMSGNTIEDGAVALVRALASNTTLSFLDLRLNRLGDNAVQNSEFLNAWSEAIAQRIGDVKSGRVLNVAIAGPHLSDSLDLQRALG